MYEPPDIKLEFDEAEMENMPMEDLRKLIVAEMKKSSHVDFNFEDDFEEELCEDY